MDNTPLTCILSNLRPCREALRNVLVSTLVQRTLMLWILTCMQFSASCGSSRSGNSAPRLQGSWLLRRAGLKVPKAKSWSPRPCQPRIDGIFRDRSLSRNGVALLCRASTTKSDTRTNRRRLGRLRTGYWYCRIDAGRCQKHARKQ